MSNCGAPGVLRLRWHHGRREQESQQTLIDQRRVSAFAGSDLEVLLRARGSGHLVLAGIATSGVVLSTLRQAADLDYTVPAWTLIPTEQTACMTQHPAPPNHPDSEHPPAVGKQSEHDCVSKNYQRRDIQGGGYGQRQGSGPPA